MNISCKFSNCQPIIILKMNSCNSDNDACCEDNEGECSYLVPEVELSEFTIRLINGDKSGSTWLVVNDK